MLFQSGHEFAAQKAGKLRTMEETLILVDELDREIGSAAKMAVHRKGSLHRAFSIFVTDSKGLLLLQRRALSKYHSGGLWANTCCGHPRPGESIIDASHRRLKEEMGFDCGLTEIFAFTYRATLTNNLIEHEVDHVLTGVYNGPPTPNAREVCDWKWIGIGELKANLQQEPQRYASWLLASFDRIASQLKRD